MENSVFYLRLGKPIPPQRLSAYLVHVSEARRRRLERFASEKDRQMSLLAQLLARYALMRETGAANAQLRFLCDRFGKPYLADYPDLHFSITHTDGCVAFAGGAARVGVDAEKLRPLDAVRLATRYFDPRETEWICRSADREAAFFSVWTKKEAYLKMLGTGLRRPLHTFCVLDEATAACLQTHRLPEHVLSVCVEDGISDNMDLFEIGVEQLLAAFDAL